ncbi:hypothetical protein F5887DRAFT_850918, partial [Amanita rubescens]
HPLVYIEWFTHFRNPDPLTGLYVVTRSTRNHRHHGAVVSADRIVRTCYLTAKYTGSISEQAW